MKANNNSPAVRLLTRAEAAAYCGVSQPVYARICPIAAIELEPGNKRMERFDTVDLDAWIDGLKAANDNNRTSADALLDSL